MSDLPLYIRLFGPLSVRCGDQEINRFGTDRTSELLAYLAHYPRSHSREVLAELIWPDHDKARTNLNQAVYTLKSLFAKASIPIDHLLHSHKDTLRLDASGFTTDVAAFTLALDSARAAKRGSAQAKRHLNRAIQLSTSAFLEGCYSNWANDERNRLISCRDDAIAELGDVTTVSDKGTDVDIENLLDSEEPPVFSFSRARTRFFGRTEEIHDLCEQLRDPVVRIVTLTGMGGIGKTRLAKQAAQHMTDMFGHDISFVPLADVHDASQLPIRILHALSLYDNDLRSPLEHIVAHIQSSPTLLILDNFEQLAESGTGLIEMLLNRLLGLKILVTSRHVLHVIGEREFFVPPLPIPLPGLSLELLLENPAVGLFVDRIRQKRFKFQLANVNAPAVSQICRKLEGIPLAIELAAAHGRDKTPEQILEGLDQRFNLLISTQHQTESRHRSLQATLEWSYESLTTELQRFLNQLSIFRDGWTAAAAAAICKVPQPTMFLNHLLERSLVISVEGGNEMRFHMLETIQEFGHEKLSAEERTMIQNEYIDYFVTFANEARNHMTDTTQKEWIDRIERERSNLYSALALSLRGTSTKPAHRLIEVLGNLWLVRSYFYEGQTLIMGLLPTVIAPDTRSRMLNVAGSLAERQGSYNTATEYFRESLHLARIAQNKSTQANALGNLGLIAWNEGRPTDARPFFEESLALDIELGDPHNIIITRMNLSNVLQAQGDISRARELLNDNLNLADKIQNIHCIAWSLGSLGQLARFEGDLNQAYDLCKRCLEVLTGLEDKLGIIIMVEESAYIMQAQGYHEEALLLLGTATATREELKAPLAPVDLAAFDSSLVAIRSVLTEKTFRRLLAKGRTIPIEKAVASILRTG